MKNPGAPMARRPGHKTELLTGVGFIPAVVPVQVRRRRQPEAQIQRALVERLAWQKPPGVWFCHIANGGYRRRAEASILSGLGLRRGAPDLAFTVAGRAYFLELKAPGGRLSQAQRECHEEIRLAGGVVGVAAGIDEATDLLREWGVLR